MAIKVDWSDEADDTFSQNIEYLKNEWGNREIEKFVLKTQQTIERLKIFPESFPVGNKRRSYRKARLNKYISLFYKYNKSKEMVTLVTFWNARQNPQKLKY